MPHAQRNKLIIEDLPKQSTTSTGQSHFGRGETVFLVKVVDNTRPTEQLGKITDADALTGAWWVNRYDDHCDSYFDRDLHKLITVSCQESFPNPSVRIRRYFHEIRLWDNETRILGEIQGHVITERYDEYAGGTPKFPPHYYVVEIVYRGVTCFSLTNDPK